MFSYETIPQYHSDLLNGTTSCVDAVIFYLSKIKDKKHLNAFTQVYGEEALEKARYLDEHRTAGNTIKKLHGVVIALKDVICYKDHPVTAASGILKNFVSVYNATAVERLLAEDAIIIGHTNCDEFAMGSTNENSVYGRVLNALDETKVPGGSSGGSAVAVQAELCMISLGSDTGGSVRQPADFCGIIGLKPTYGRISRYGLIAYASSFDQIGIFGKNVVDIAILLKIIAGKDEFDSTVSGQAIDDYHALQPSFSKPLRIGYLKEAFQSPALDKDIQASMYGFIETQKKHGHTVEAIDFEFLDYIVPAYYILTTAEASSNLSRFDGIRYGFRNVDKKTDLTDLYCRTRSNGFGKEVKRRIMLGTFVLSAGYYEAYFTKAQHVRQLLKEKIKLIFNDFDALILPTAPSTAFSIGEKLDDPIAMYLADIFTVFSNLIGTPSISIPLFWHKNGLPYGLQVMTNHFCELSLLQLSNYWIEQYKSPDLKNLN
ncbi:MAG: Asp-tRNA(Asn)/Glu-tRNA(Gln) amidotransferase subunit GatA [Chitinophagaceae bacterium]|nr:Asp-tRNA(Asn)/Glu-tRNA(Gln) amidotransferase subunit GatA [Chitinophagaceae bacterium]